MLWIPLVALCVGCTDRSPVGPDSRPTGAFRMLALVACTVDTRAGTVVCRETGAGQGDGPSLAILGKNQIKMASANVVSDTAAGRFSFDATVQNLLLEPIGTPDGITTTGIKVFVESGPTATSYTVGDTGRVWVVNADGQATFSAANQPYFRYDTLLASNAVSAPKRWIYGLSKTVKTFSFTVRVFTATPSETPVPEVVPDGIPAWVFDPANLANDDAPDMAGRFPRDVLLVRFNAGTPLEERQAAIDLVRGRVIGGTKLDEYAVQVADEPNSRALFRAIRALEALPHVAHARPEHLLSPLYLAPTDDSAGWRRQDYRLNPDSANGRNWSFERIAAPWAWGCSVGTDSSRIALLDIGFHAVRDVQRNTAGGVPALGSRPLTVDHGTRVASLVAARGNDTTGMTGVMWRAALEPYDVGGPGGGISTSAFIDSYVLAVRRSRVINISMGLYWSGTETRLPHTAYIDSLNNRARDSMRAAGVHELVRSVVLRGDTIADSLGVPRALLVIAASNDGIDASWSGVANLAADFPDRVIIVGASDSTNALAAFSNRNGGSIPAVYTASPSLVSIVAPGRDVPVLSGAGAIVTDSGTSFAAPQVSGVAGLLYAADPRLTAAELRTFILNGATRGGRTAGGIRLLNAYEALKLAAERPGAPLCGNRLWIANGSINAQRGAATESLFPAPANASWVGGMHGGLVRLWDPNTFDDRIYRWRTVGWNEVAATDSAYDSLYEDYGPAINSAYGWSHDGDAAVYMTTTAAGATIEIRNFAAGTGRRHLATLPVQQTSETGWFCTRRASPTACLDSTYSSRTSGGGLAVAYSPRGDQILASTSSTSGSAQPDGAWYECPQQGGTDPENRIWCINVRWTSSPAVGYLYRITGIDSGSPTWTQIHTEANRLTELAIADMLPRAGQPREFYATLENNSSSGVVTWIAVNGASILPNQSAEAWHMVNVATSGSSSSNCSGTFRSLTTLAELQAKPGCVYMGGSFAPSRTPTSAARSGAGPQRPRRPGPARGRSRR